MKTATKVHLLVIDPQNDFCDIPVAEQPAGPLAASQKLAPALPVAGADQDMKRLAAFIDRVGNKLFDIHVTLNTPIGLKEVRSSSHDIRSATEQNGATVIGLNPNVEPPNNRDFILDYRLAGDRIESGVPALGAYDGLLTDATAHWSRICERGISPTGLEAYARCPFQYFSAQVLDLDAMRQTVSMELSPPAMGQLCHDALRLCYEVLIRQGWVAAASSDSVITTEVTRAVTQAFAAYAMTHGTGYALTWQLAQETVRHLVEATVRFDREAAATSGFIPVECEIDAKGVLQDGTTGDAIALRGRWDRLDRHPLSGALRVIDYKYRANDRVEAKDRQLLQAAVRAQRLQPALYALMAVAESGDQAHSLQPEQVEFLYLLPQGMPAVERASFAASCWQGASGPMLSRTMQVLLDGIRSGRHFIVPDAAHCDYCEFATACRKAHQPSLWRLRRSPLAGALHAVRLQKVARD